MKKFIVALAVLLLPAVTAYSQCGSIMRNDTNSNCVGSQIRLILDCSGCQAPTWSFSSPDVVTWNNQDHTDVTVTYNSAGTKQIDASYIGCTQVQFPPLEISNPSNLSVTGSISGATSVCEGTGVTLVATPSQTQGTRSYTYRVKTPSGTVLTPAAGTSSASFTFYTTGLDQGSYKFYVEMVNSGYSCLNQTTATSYNSNEALLPAFTVNAKTPYTSDLNPPGLICGTGSKTMDFVAYTSAPGNVTYSWRTSEGATYNSGSATQSLTFDESSVVRVQIATDACATISSPAAWTPTYTPAVTPSASINFSPQNYCPGSLITFTASSPQATASTTYSWRLNGSNEFHMGATAQLTASATVVNGTFYNGSVVTVKANNLSAQCLTPPNEATGTTSGTPLNVYPVPEASATSSPICSASAVNAAITDPSNGAGTTFAWTVGHTNASGGTASSGSTINQALTATSTTQDGSVVYGITPTRNGCTGPLFNLTVTVKRRPAITDNAGQLNPAVCSGTALSFTPTISVASSIYSWTSGTVGNITSGVTASGSTPITDTPINTGNTNGTVTYAITPSFNLCPGDPANYAATIKPIPTVFVDPSTQTICTGASTAITVTNPNNVTNATITWNVAQSSSTGASDNLTGIQSGSVIDQVLSNSPSTAVGTTTYSILASANGCSSSPAATATVTINPKPTTVATVTGNYRFDVGTYSLSASGATGGDTYEWFNAASQSQFVGIPFSTSSFSSNTANAYFVRTRNSQGCLGPQTWVDVTVYALPVISATSPYVYLGLTSTLSTGSYDTYAWKRAASPVATTSTHETNVPGSYTVQVVKNGATGISAPYFLKGQFDDQDANYVLSRDVLVDGITPSTVIEQQPVHKINQKVDYFDGLGRPLQSIATQASPMKNDIVQTSSFDKYGREAYKHLPFVSENNGWLKANVVDAAGLPTGAAASFYQNTSGVVVDTKPYAKTVFESSPLNRPIDIGAPGVAFQPGAGNSVRMAYLVNGDNEVLNFIFHAESYSVGVNPSSPYFASNMLLASKVTNEDEGEVITYVDKEGRTICKKVKISPTEFASTYYVFDDAGNLVFVLPPEAIKKILADL
jgi:hypothetical protein